MKKIIFILIISLFLVAWTNAEYRIYNNVEDFEKDKWAICEAASDGCNNYFMTDWKVMWWTRMYCADHTPEWTCTKFKENTITTMSLDIIEENNVVICTMEYAPVCWVAWKTYSNRCLAENAAKVEVNYEWACRIKKELSSINDQKFYDTIKNRLDIKFQKSIDKAIIKYERNLDKYSDSKKKKLNDIIITRVENKISDLLMQYPADIELPKTVNDKYLTFTLLKFELMKLEF